MRVRANQYISIPEVSSGDIVALSGLKDVVAGETLIGDSNEEFILSPL